MSDHDRPLSERGRRDATATGQLVASLIGGVDLALVSDATRAQQTWALAGISAAEERLEPRIYEASTDALLTVVGEIPTEVHTALMVGHNPGFESLAQLLAGDASDTAASRQLAEKFPTCAVAVLDSAAPFSQWESAEVRLRAVDVARGT